MAAMQQAGFQQPDDGAVGPWFRAPPRDEIVDPRRTERESPARAVRLGVLAGVGFPSLVNVGVTARLGRWLGVGANGGWLPETQLPVYGQATIKYQSYDAYLRVYPIAGFFLGAGAGYRTISGTVSQSFDVPYAGENGASANLAIGTSAKVSSWVLTPQAGYLHTFGSGFSLGVEAGATVPISSGKVSVRTTLPEGTPALASDAVTKEEEDTMKRVGRAVLPSLSLRMGWMF